MNLATSTQPILTYREQQILALICKEFSSHQIASSLNISVRTVETHRKNICQKLKTKSIIGLFKYAIQNGLVENYNYFPEVSFKNKNLNQLILSEIMGKQPD